MDVNKMLAEISSFSDHTELRAKNLKTILQFMTDEEDAVTGRQKEKRLNRYRLYTPDGMACRYGAGYIYKGEERLRRRDEVTVARFPVWFTTEIKVYHQTDPNLFVVIGKAGGARWMSGGRSSGRSPMWTPV